MVLPFCAKLTANCPFKGLMLPKPVTRSLGSPVNSCVYPQILATLNKKNFISLTPLSEALNALILALKDSAEAFVERLLKKFNISS